MRVADDESNAQTLNPIARNCSRPSSVIFSGPHGGNQTQLILKSVTKPSRALRVWSSITSVSGQAAEVRVMSIVATAVIVKGEVVDETEVDHVDAQALDRPRRRGLP